MANSLVLTIQTSPNIILVKDTKMDTITLDSVEYTMALQSINFTKKMYEPGVINANIQFKVSQGDWKTISKTNLDSIFKDKSVVLNYGEASKGSNGKWTVSGATVCSSYYIREVRPLYKNKALFVTFVIFSVDKMLTLTKGCNSFVSKRLGRDILDTNKTVFALPYDSKKHVDYNYDNLKNIAVSGDHKEAIFPYLVQYNESYYDFLVRTCNRWGEFLYFENDKLTIGYDNSTQNNKTIYGTAPKDVNNPIIYSNYIFCNLNNENNDTADTTRYADGATYDNNMLNNPFDKSSKDKVANVMGCSMEDGGDVWTTKIIGNLLSSGKNLWDFAVDTVVDEGIARGQVQKRVNKNNDDFDGKYFKVSSSSKADLRAHYDSSYKSYNEYSDATPHLTGSRYSTILKGEIEAAHDAVCIDFDTTYYDLKLGTIFTIDSGTQKYMVVQVNTKEKEELTVENGKVKPIYTTTYQVIAIKQNADATFYPTIHPAGHIRTSGPQRAKIVEESKGDPTNQGRVKVQFPWQGAGTSGETPWLEYMHPGGKGTGTYHRHYKDEEVIVAFANGNVERPYVIGSFSDGKQKAPGSTIPNNIVHVTPAGQAIKMSDGTGAGMTAWLAGMAPSWKMVQGFYPGAQLGGLSFEGNESFEGSIELTDKYGMYSIKGSSDGRNVSIKSPYGDVKLNAFTGITISAPNGDIKIAGKNVTIEAGNNLTLTSGKNITDGFFCSYRKNEYQEYDLLRTVAAAVTKKIASMVGGFIDFTMVRNVVEVFMRPIEGKLTVKSNRYLALEAGTGKTAYPVDAYCMQNTRRIGIGPRRTSSFKAKQAAHDALVRNQFNEIKPLVSALFTDFNTKYVAAHTFAARLQNKINENTIPGEPAKLPCKTFEELLDAVWSNPDANVDDNFMGFKELLAAADNYDAMTPEMRTRFAPAQDEVMTDEKRKEETHKRYKQQKDVMKAVIEDLQLNVKPIKDFTINPFLGRLENEVQQRIDDTVLDNTVIHHCTDDNDVKYFKMADLSTYRNQQETPLVRTLFIKLVEDIYRFKRAKTGGINGVGAKTPDVPRPFANPSEAEWNAYVNSIQAMPPLEKEKGAAAETKDFFQQYLGDPILKQAGLVDLLSDVVDNCAFGANKSGKILFASEGTGTMTLENDIMRANVDKAEDSNLYGVGFVSTIRRTMW